MPPLRTDKKSLKQGEPSQAYPPPPPPYELRLRGRSLSINKGESCSVGYGSPSFRSPSFLSPTKIPSSLSTSSSSSQYFRHLHHRRNHIYHRHHHLSRTLKISIEDNIELNSDAGGNGYDRYPYPHITFAPPFACSYPRTANAADLQIQISDRPPTPRMQIQTVAVERQQQGQAQERPEAKKRRQEVPGVY